MGLGPFGDIGPCQIYWNDTAIASLLEGGATFRFTGSVSPDVKEAEFGNTPLDGTFTGYEQVEFEAPFTRLTYANLAKIIPGGSNSGGESGNVAVFAHQIVGASLVGAASELIVKRIVSGVVDTSQKYWLHIPLAYPIPQFDIPYNLNDQRGFMVLFKCYANETTGLVWHVGDH